MHTESVGVALSSLALACGLNMEVALTLVTLHHVYSSYSASLSLLLPSSCVLLRHSFTWVSATPSSHGREQLHTGQVVAEPLASEGSGVELDVAHWLNRICRLFTESSTFTHTISTVTLPHTRTYTRPPYLASTPNQLLLFCRFFAPFGASGGLPLFAVCEGNSHVLQPVVFLCVMLLHCPRPHRHLTDRAAQLTTNLSS